MSKVKGI